jgi:hypothetical protein
MRYIVPALAFVAALLACDTLPLPPGTGGAGGVGSSSSASSSASVSSSSGVVDTCDLEYVASVCDDCKVNGCPMAKDDDEPCHRIGVVHYTDMLGCLQMPGPQASCPPCQDITFGMPITAECVTCAEPHTNCSFDCAFAVTGGKQ